MSDTQAHLEFAEGNLDHIANLLRKLMRTAKGAADKADHVIVPRERHARLERLAEAVSEAAKTAAMTRDYKDAIENGSVEYRGKKFLLGRTEFEEVLRSLKSIK